MARTATRLTKRKKKQMEIETKNQLSCLSIHPIKPLTINQNKAIKSYYNNQNLFLYGYAGTGKSYLALHLAIEEVLSGLSTHEKLVIVRSAVAVRDVGFLPGSAKEKVEEYEMPYRSMCAEIFGKGDAYDLLKTKSLVHFIPTSFIRGCTINNAIIFVDECQNMTAKELNSIITRVGKNCRIIFAGDMRQTDLYKKNDKSGIADFMKIIRAMNIFDFIEFQAADIVRSQIVRNYIVTRTRLEDSGEIETLGV